MKARTVSILWAIAGWSLAARIDSVAAEADVVKGTGYIDLKGDMSAPPPDAVATGPRFAWIPVKGSIFIGSAQTNQNYTISSVSLLGQAGNSAVALLGSSDEIGIAIGSEAVAGNSIAIGRRSGAWGAASIAVGTELGDDNNYWAHTTSLAGIAIGNWSNSSASFAVSIGSHTTSSGVHSTALGAYTSSAGDYSTAFGYGSQTIGDYSFAFGISTSTYASGSTSMGMFNRGGKRKDTTVVNPVIADPRDPLLTLGNGTGESDSQRSNAFTVYRDGDAHFAGSIRMKRAGDISMGSFTAGPSREP